MKKYLPGVVKFATLLFGMWLATFALVTVTNAKFNDEPFEGKVAVAQVTMNRAASGNFPGDICAVVYQKNIVYSKVVCQFSWACNGSHRLRPVYAPLYRESEEVAKKVLLENFRLPSLKRAMYFHADYIKPGWGKQPVAKIGHHIFYSDS